LGKRLFWSDVGIYYERDLDVFQEYAFVPEELKLSYKIFKNASILPSGIQLKKSIEESNEA